MSALQPYPAISQSQFIHSSELLDNHFSVWEKPLTRLEMDPVAHGKALAREIAAYLRGGAFPSRFVLGSKWVEGKTF